jgi:hypothetical protein
LSIRGETSPVKAPFSSQCIFWAPSFTFVPTSFSAAAYREVKGGQITISTVSSFTFGKKLERKSKVSLLSLFIFQLPAIKGILDIMNTPDFIILYQI